MMPHNYRSEKVYTNFSLGFIRVFDFVSIKPTCFNPGITKQTSSPYFIPIKPLQFSRNCDSFEPWLSAVYISFYGIPCRQLTSCWFLYFIVVGFMFMETILYRVINCCKNSFFRAEC